MSDWPQLPISSFTSLSQNPSFEDLMLLLSGCPILDELFIYDVMIDSENSKKYKKWKSFSLSNLTRADVDSAFFPFPLNSLHNVQYLRIEIPVFEATAEVFWSNDAIATFHNLTTMYLNTLNCRWHILVEVLKQCPKLQNLNIDETSMDKDKESWTRKDNKENWLDPEFVPQCISLHLRTCNIFSFLGQQGELLLATYILRNARVLQTMKIWTIGQPKIKRLLSSCPRASSTCKLTFHHVPSCDCRKISRWWFFECYSRLYHHITIGGTFRAFSNKSFTHLRDRIEQVIIGQAAVYRCNATVNFFEEEKPSYPPAPTVNHGELHDYFKSIAGSLIGADKVNDIQPLMGSEDFAFYQEALPGYISFLGMEDTCVEHLANAHSPHFKINEDALPYGAALHASLAYKYLVEFHQKVPVIEGKHHDEL